MANYRDPENQGRINGQKQAEVVVVMVPFPAQGHLNQLLHLSRLILSYNIPVHYASSAIHNRQAKLRLHGWGDPNSLSNNIHFHDFVIPPFLSPPPNPKSPNKFPSHLQPLFNASLHLRHPMDALVRELSSKARRVIVINDSMMAYVVQDVVSIPNAESYTFHSVSAFAFVLYLWEAMGKVRLPFEANGKIPKDIPSLESCFTNEFLDFISLHSGFQKLSSGSLYNTCRIIEGPYLDLMEKIEGDKKHWAFGPFNPVTIPAEKKITSNGRHKCLDWLHKQAPNSVIYVSFGTTTTMEEEQIKELAIGLQKSEQKFIWVLRDADKGDVFNGSEEVRKAELPKGFEERVKDRGMVVRDWAPQLEILSHPSTGAFMSHCGWNSCMESITMGVPIAAWPMASDQPSNTVLIAQLLKVGIVVKDWSHQLDQIVTSDCVENALKMLMASKEGDVIRKRAADLGGAVRRSLDEGGVSCMELDSFIAHITR